MFNLIVKFLTVLMADVTEEAKARLHRIRVRLYKNHLPTVEGEFFAKTVNEATVSVPEVCASLKDRGHYPGDTTELARLFMLVMREAGHLLCDGFGVNFHYFSIHPHVGGIFEKAREGVTPEKHPVLFKFRVRSALRRLADLIEVYVEGVAESGACIDEFTDIKTGAINEIATPNSMFSITGLMVRIDGARDETGISFVTPGIPSIALKVTENLAENGASKIIGMIPDLPPGKTWELVIRTRYAGSGKPLKEVREIKSGFTITT